MSATKIGIVVLIVLGALVALRILRRIQKSRGEEAPPEEVLPCSVCGSYVARTLAQPCGRDDCPFLVKK
jgi:hypothetical protein